MKFTVHFTYCGFMDVEATTEADAEEQIRGTLNAMGPYELYDCLEGPDIGLVHEKFEIPGIDGVQV